MKIFDEDDKIKRLFKEFQKVDEFYNSFKVEFNANIVSVIKVYHPEFKRSDRFDEFINQYAVTVLNTTQTVLDKDESYPDYRKTEDLEAMQTYFAKAVQLAQNIEMADDIHKKAKEMVVKYYPKVIDLSSEGFRLLELNLKLFNMEFVANYNNLD